MSTMSAGVRNIGKELVRAASLIKQGEKQTANQHKGKRMNAREYASYKKGLVA